MTDYKNTKVLDCTLRDGGYYNNWDFDLNTVQAYLRAMEQSGVDIIELGLRTPPKNEFFGPYAYTTDKFLSKLTLPKNLQIGVMINGKDFISTTETIEQKINQFFSHRTKSPVSVVRIAIHMEEIGPTQEIVKALKNLGYFVGLNIMQIGTKADHEIESAAKAIEAWNQVDVLYFADSLGNMNAEDVSRVIKLIQKHWKGEVGIHTHNNMGLALNNTLTALSLGATYLDSTILGMGRGAGNAKTEYLLIELNKLGLSKFQPESVFPIVLGEFKKLQKEYDWGENLPYYLAASYQIHPTFIQEMLGNESYKSHHLISALTTLKNEDSKSYNIKQLKKALSPTSSSSDGSWSPKNWIKSKSILLVANGGSLERYAQDVSDLIKMEKLPTLSLNINKFITPELINAYVACNQMRFNLEFDQYKELNRPIIMPFQSAPEIVKKLANEITIYDYGMEINENYSSQEYKCVIKSPMAISYALSICEVLGVEEVFLAGFDGLNDVSKNQESQQVFDHFKTKMKITSITPTTYNVNNKSLFAF